MTALQKLWFYKQKGIIRNLFRKPSSAIITVLIVVFYGFIIVGALLSKDQIAVYTATLGVQKSIMIIIGFTAFMMVTMLFSSRKALFYEQEAFYLFSGPFTKKQQMKYLLAQTILQSILFSCVSLFLGIVSFSEVSFAPLMILLTFLVTLGIYFFFLILTDYLYVLEICYKKFKNISKIVGTLVVLMVATVIGLYIIKSGLNIKEGFYSFITGEIFYFVPILGLAKLAMVSFVEQEYILTVIGVLLVFVPAIIIYLLFINFKGNFYEQALEDAIKISEYTRKSKRGDTTVTAKVKHKEIGKSKFLNGAWAILSKSVVELKKTGQFISISDITIVGIYIVFGIISKSFEAFTSMLIIYLFVSPQNTGIKKEMENYFIYLIPDSPLKKLIAIILPPILRTSLITVLAVVISGLLLKVAPALIIYNSIMFVGYSVLVTSGMVLSLKILKSRSNQVLENLLRGLIILVCFIPSIIVIIFLSIAGMDIVNLMNIANYIPVIMNFIISILIILVCKNMLNGKELISD
ncbi:putative ABC exporter domain-containing protein [Miniphocaeibacter halophilus]|uniref:ABC exporter domain-containing protein n=1 Tax=Miniphocaeibacter halophilus TaxID=2931922 RepID=A0AC61MP43_9FIRM|nr:putative ABC exporter domain-containing protein [Miniphocaeibacter halophilus]QQK07272.1 putative ABC exporter domain-containing protein [Miniphocaeibacter halophilus]